MKQFIWILTVIILVLSLAACGGTPQTEENASLGDVVELPDNADQQEPDTQQENTTPETTLPENTTPENTTPENTVPENTTPENTTPENTKPENTTPEETTPEQTIPEQTTPEESEEEEQEPSYEGWIKLASYNTKSLMHSADKEGIVKELKEIDADIVGLQELDSFTSRSGAYNQMEYLATECGYPYWSFDKLIDYGGGEYGMGILSRYPIKESKVVQYNAQCEADSHVRKYGRHVLDVNGRELVFYNTHLSIRDGEDETSVPQLKELFEKMNKDQYALLTGDFNMKAPVAATAIKSYKNLQILNSGDSSTAYIGDKLAADYIDNIMTTKTFDTYWDDWSGTGIMVSQTPYSDHNMVYTYVNFK